MNDGTMRMLSQGELDIEKRVSQSSTTVSGGKLIYYPISGTYAPGNTPKAKYGMSQEFFRKGQNIQES